MSRQSMIVVALLGVACGDDACPARLELAETCYRTESGLFHLEAHHDALTFREIGTTLIDNAVACVRGPAQDRVREAAARYRSAVARRDHGDAIHEVEVARALLVPANLPAHGCGDAGRVRDAMCAENVATLARVARAVFTSEDSTSPHEMRLPLMRLAMACIGDNLDWKAIAGAAHDFSLAAHHVYSGHDRSRALAVEKVWTIHAIVEAACDRWPGTARGRARRDD
jgi:hypothetical protein